MRRQSASVMRDRVWRLGVAALFSGFFLGCSSNMVSPDPSLQALVGDWRADSLVLTSVANPDVSVDLIATGATFTLNVQPSGEYTAILISGRKSSTEIGQLSTSADRITLRRAFPTPPDTTTGRYSLSGNRLTIDGETDYEFVQGVDEAAIEHLVLSKQ